MAKKVTKSGRSRPSSASSPTAKRLRSATKQREKTQKIDPKMPKKPPTAFFFFFLEDFRQGFQEQNPDVKSMRDIGKACGEKWKIMTYEEKVKYYDIATEKQAEFDRAMESTLRERKLVKTRKVKMIPRMMNRP